MSDQEDWMERIKSLVLDDNQVVTYKVASRELGVHVNTAKQMLFAVAEENTENLDVLYLVSGRDGDGRLNVKVTSGDHQLTSVTSKHVYAIASKGKVNARDVLSADMTASAMPSKHGAVGNKMAVPRQRTQGQEEAKAAPPPAKSESKEEKQVDKNHSKPVTKNDCKSAAPVKASSNTSKGAATVKSNSLKGMFEKASRKTVKKSEPAIKKEEEKEPSPGKENRLNEEKEEKSQTGTNGATKSKKRPKKDSTSSVNKRRRIQVMSDSEESADDKEEEEDESVKECDDEAAPPQAKLIQSDSEDDDIVPPTPEAPKSKITNGDSKETSKRARIKKRVTKTYVDETGFLCTKQEMQSCSESEGEAEQKKDSPAKSKPGSEEKKQETAKPKAKAPPVNSSGTKQASIMNFFKKK